VSVRLPGGRWVGLLTAALGAFVAVVLFNAVIMPRFVRRGAVVRVPPVERMALPQAEGRLAQAGLTSRVSSRRASPDVEEGFVIVQEPAAGRLAKHGRQVSLIVSQGKGATLVPDVRGQSIRTAEIRFVEGGFRLGRTIRAPSDERVGTILATTPPAGGEADPGAAIDCLVSEGRRPEPLVMPLVEGLPAGQVLDWFESHDLAVVVKRSFEDSGRPGLIVRQEPRAGQRLDPWEEIALYVSR
jgi:beta-lactam-binding protein with PASTA domain